MEKKMKITSLEHLLEDELKDIYSAENQVLKAMPRMRKAVHSHELQNILEHHLEQTHQHVRRLEDLCERLGINPRGKKCAGMQGLIEEVDEILRMDGEAEPLEAGMIGAVQRIEHYEISAYGTARAHARQLGYVEAVKSLSETLGEEKTADEKLTKIAENKVNVQAAMMTGDRLESL
jgi:ferritin-like metal-binding protein YciE